MESAEMDVNGHTITCLPGDWGVIGKGATVSFDGIDVRTFACCFKRFADAVSLNANADRTICADEAFNAALDEERKAAEWTRVLAKAVEAKQFRAEDDGTTAEDYIREAEGRERWIAWMDANRGRFAVKDER